MERAYKNGRWYNKEVEGFMLFKWWTLLFLVKERSKFKQEANARTIIAGNWWKLRESNFYLSSKFLNNKEHKIFIAFSMPIRISILTFKPLF